MASFRSSLDLSVLGSAVHSEYSVLRYTSCHSETILAETLPFLSSPASLCKNITVSLAVSSFLWPSGSEHHPHTVLVSSRYISSAWPLSAIRDMRHCSRAFLVSTFDTPGFPRIFRITHIFPAGLATSPPLSCDCALTGSFFCLPPWWSALHSWTCFLKTFINGRTKDSAN